MRVFGYVRERDRELSLRARDRGTTVEAKPETKIVPQISRAE